MDPKNQNFENIKIRPGDIIIFHMCTINDNHYDVWFLRGQNNSWSMDMTSQILHFVHPKFSVITEMTSHFFLEQLEKISLEIP